MGISNSCSSASIGDRVPDVMIIVTGLILIKFLNTKLGDWHAISISETILDPLTYSIFYIEILM